MAKQKWFRVRGRLQLEEKPTGPGGGNGNGNGNGENGNGNGENGDVTGITPEVPTILPDPPPGVWPGPTPHVPVLGPLSDELKQTLPPGGVWPIPGHTSIPGNYVALAFIPRHGWKYIIIDPDAIQMPQIDRPGPPGTRR